MNEYQLNKNTEKLNDFLEKEKNLEEINESELIELADCFEACYSRVKETVLKIFKTNKKTFDMLISSIEDLSNEKCNEQIDFSLHIKNDEKKHYKNLVDKKDLLKTSCFFINERKRLIELSNEKDKEFFLKLEKLNAELLKILASKTKKND